MCAGPSTTRADHSARGHHRHVRRVPQLRGCRLRGRDADRTAGGERLDHQPDHRGCRRHLRRDRRRRLPITVSAPPAGIDLNAFNIPGKTALSATNGTVTGGAVSGVPTHFAGAIATIPAASTNVTAGPSPAS